MNMSFEKIATPSRELGELAISSYESLAEIQIKSALELNRMSIESVKSAVSITGPEDLKSYIADQTAKGKVVAESMVADVKAAGEIGQSYMSEAKKVVESSFKA